MSTPVDAQPKQPVKVPGDSDRKVIQGLVARNYDRMKAVSHIVLKVQNVAAAGDFIEQYKGRVATVEDDGARTCLNIGFTFHGLSAFLKPKQIEALANKRELRAFVSGAVDRAGQVGDIDKNDPRSWKEDLGKPENVDVLLSVYAEDMPLLQGEVEKILADALPGFGKPVSRNPGEMLPDGRIHFGYKDGISQPNITGLRNNGDKQEAVPAGAFVLGYDSQFAGHEYDYDFPKELGHNGTFAAFRIMKQDVQRFEQFLTDKAAETKTSRELVAARLCGRWRDGTSLVVSPEYAANDPTNDFKYKLEAPGKYVPDSVCPFSSHVRRTNPRDDKVAGLSGGTKHRIVRSTMPYGKPYDIMNKDYIEGQPNFEERGLIGLFFCVNLEDQFEFIMKNWVMRGGFNGNLPASNSDPMIGLDSFVQTRGAAYFFMPSTVGLQYLVDIGRRVESVGG
jgi:Dyp-type peroxidase family